jgi:U3 small nucleolar RNA-associated protein 10
MPFPSPQGMLNAKGHAYVELQRTVYTLAHAHARARAPTGFLRSLFANLADEALVFLVGTALSQDKYPEVRTTALWHAAAFLDAHKSAEAGVDFQVVLPALIVCLPILDRPGREAVMGCILRMAGEEGDEGFGGVYGVDTVYGEGSGECFFKTWTSELD